MANEVTLEIQGLDQLNARLRDVAALVVGRAGAALRSEAELIMTAAKERTPVRYGHLRASGSVAGPSGPEQEVTLSFGGNAAPYAIYVHENLEARHDPPYGHGGQAKFLESAVLEAASSLPDRLVARMGTL